MQKKNNQKCYIGIDVAKEKLDVHCSPNNVHKVIPNNDDGFQKLVDLLKPMKPTIIVMEGTGGYETLAALHLNAEGLPVAIVNARQVRDFAKAIGHLAKTDKIDAEVLARFAEAIKPKATFVSDKKSLEFKELVTRRRQLIKISEGEKCRLAKVTSPIARASIKEIILVLGQQLKDINRQIEDLIKQTPEWHIESKVLQSVKGVGPATSASLIAALPELGRLNRRKIASLVGLAPFNHDSGKMRGRRSIRGGRHDVRKALYMATLVAIRYNHEIKVFRERLQANGKQFKVVMVACMRKLLIILNAMMREEIARNNTYFYKAS